jgi:hypothetical protein
MTVSDRLRSPLRKLYPARRAGLIDRRTARSDDAALGRSAWSTPRRGYQVACALARRRLPPIRAASRSASRMAPGFATPFPAMS